jgi:hypothetical protein
MLLEQSKRARKLKKDKLETINVSIGQDQRELKIGTLITASKIENLISLLHEYVDVFSWSYTDMSSLVHKVSLNEESILMKLKLRRTDPDMVLIVKTEIERQ